MNLKLSFVRTADKKLPTRPVTDVGSMRCTSTNETTPTSFTKYLGELGFAAIKKQQDWKVAGRQVMRKSEAPRGLLGRVFSWLNGNCSTPKQLKVLETVALGDKRMVAMIQADGRRFLVGGGPSGVSLLTPLDQIQKPLGEFSSSAGLRELAG